MLDRHAMQLKQLTSAVTNITTLIIQQSDSTSFLLREHIVIKEDVATLKTDVTETKLMQTEVGSKLDLILAKLK